ncbi:hypothetical protein [Neorhizobium alkalisoli]|uniref:Uncharacterized protein n=1 Tax=Neorhizobium alkalisoli TaxID=528178 RepID=A0A561PVY0_9HYPH|nr:hypothetical protein [Neorhizobium alkalisoli]TWF42208.1 hypothetical protein FHW37_1249 [Neorhizobium alkalisoli]
MISRALRELRAAYQFVYDVRLGADLGYDWPSAVKFAWSVWGWQEARA